MTGSFPVDPWRARTDEGRRLIALAREHIGAAGFEQSATLEHLIAVGREQDQVRTALVDVLRTLRVAPASSTRGPSLHDLRAAGQAQLDFTRDLQGVLGAALARITATPVQHISAELLQDICDQTQSHVEALEQLIQETREAIDDPAREAQLAALQQDIHDAAQHVEQEVAQGQVESLSALGQDAVERLANVEGAPTARQVEALEQVARAAQQQADQLKQG